MRTPQQDFLLHLPRTIEVAGFPACTGTGSFPRRPPIKVIMNIQRIPVSKLNPSTYNPRKDLKPGDPEYDKLATSMEAFGYIDPIVWNERTGNVISGHQRLKILIAQGKVEDPWNIYCRKSPAFSGR